MQLWLSVDWKRMLIARVLAKCTRGKNNFAEVSINLSRYRSENNFIGLSKYNSNIGFSNMSNVAKNFNIRNQLERLNVY